MNDKQKLLDDLVSSYDLCTDAIINAVHDPNGENISWLEDPLNIAELHEVIREGSGFECFEKISTELVRITMHTTLQTLEECDALNTNLKAIEGIDPSGPRDVAGEFIVHLLESARL